jgi:uncharacterized protein (DUF486 family)
MTTILLLCLSNVFMTFAWYGHLKFLLEGKPMLWVTILLCVGHRVLRIPVSWCPPTGSGYFTGKLHRLPTEDHAGMSSRLAVFVGFAWLVLGEKLKLELRRELRADPRPRRLFRHRVQQTGRRPAVVG